MRISIPFTLSIDAPPALAALLERAGVDVAGVVEAGPVAAPAAGAAVGAAAADADYIAIGRLLRAFAGATMRERGERAAAWWAALHRWERNADEGDRRVHPLALLPDGRAARAVAQSHGLGRPGKPVCPRRWALFLSLVADGASAAAARREVISQLGASGRFPGERRLRSRVRALRDSSAAVVQEAGP